MDISLLDKLPDKIAARISQGAPGFAAMKPFSPELSYGRHAGPALDSSRQAATIALLCRSGPQWVLPLTLRPQSLPEHAGQVCFPGGALNTNEAPRQAALRELHEELGVQDDRIAILGSLTSIYVFATNYWVTPFVGVLDHVPEFSPCEREVAEVVMVPLSELLNKANYGLHQIERRGLRFKAPHIEFEGHRIWGATSMILGELIGVLESIQSPTMG